MFFFHPTSIFDSVMREEGSNFREIGNFSNLQVHISNTVHCSELKHLLAYFPFNSERDDAPFENLDQIYVMHSTTKRDSVALTGKFARGQTGPIAHRQR